MRKAHEYMYTVHGISKELLKVEHQELSVTIMHGLPLALEVLVDLITKDIVHLVLYEDNVFSLYESYH